jgi:heme A synthase
MLDRSTPQVRALTKTVFFVLTVLISAGLVILGLEVFGLATVGMVLAVAVFCFFVYLAYSITLSQEQYRDQLRELQKTVRE